MTTMTGKQKIGDIITVDAAETAMELEETTTSAAVGQVRANPKNKKEVATSAHTSTMTTTTGMQKIDEGKEEEE
jgi:hypothetical protein